MVLFVCKLTTNVLAKNLSEIQKKIIGTSLKIKMKFMVFCGNNTSIFRVFDHVNSIDSVANYLRNFKEDMIRKVLSEMNL